MSTCLNCLGEGVKITVSSPNWINQFLSLSQTLCSYVQRVIWFVTKDCPFSPENRACVNKHCAVFFTAFHLGVCM